jgi:peptidoglycan hydrolase-like protein with peptidoglycan-binding domain
MNRTLTAAVALAAALGMAGLAQAQTSSTTQSSPLTTSPSASQPGMSGTSGAQNPATMTAPGATGTSGTTPQASTNQNMGAQGNPTQASQPASQSQIQQAQQQLKSAGLYRGSVDGVMGPETQTALMAFQREQGLPQTAQLDQQTMQRLNGSSGGSTTNSGTQPSGTTPSMAPAGAHSGGTSSGMSGGSNSR